MDRFLTTAEAAQRLTERGIHTSTGKNYTPRMIQIYCMRGVFPGAYHEGDRWRGAWRIPRHAVEQFETPKRGPKRTRPRRAPGHDAQGGSDDRRD